MLRIISHLETLLLDHNCVIVPKLGGFVLQEQGFDYIGQTHTFSTTSKSISFNKSLQHNDGLLTESYMKMYATSFEDAKAMIETDVKEINRAIIENNSVDLSTLGVLKLEDGIINFYPSDDKSLFCAETYGLEDICLPTLNELLNIPEETQEKDTIYIPIKRKTFKWVAAAAAIILIAVTISIPTLDNLSLKTNYASIIPKQTIKALNGIHTHNTYTGINDDISTLIDKIAEPNEDALASPSDSIAFEITSTEVISDQKETNQDNSAIQLPIEQSKEAAKKDSTKVATTLPKQEKKGVMINMTPSKTKEYYIVVGSFPNKAQALQLYDKLAETKIQTLGIIERDGKFRIYANKFENRESADKYLLDLKKKPEFKDAWVFATK